MTASRLLLIAGLAAQTLASCSMSSSTIFQLYRETDSSLCQPQGAGMWTFAMSTGMAGSTAQTPMGGPRLAGTMGSTTFSIADEDCNVRGIYSVPNCGIPATIQDDFLVDTLTLTNIDTDVYDPSFRFTYGSSEYEFDSSDCDCAPAGPGPALSMHCKCAFAVNGIDLANDSSREATDATRSGEKFIHMLAKKFEA